MHNSYLITGGAGFIGTNLCEHYLTQGKSVTILDNFARPGSEKNVQWLLQQYGEALTVIEADVAKSDGRLHKAVHSSDVVFHLAGQVAVTTSVVDPRTDFEANALGTINVLEAVRLSKTNPIFVYSSTNKVYGKMESLNITERGGRYCYGDLPNGIAETHPLDFYSPYGCSKGAGDQYVLDYARIYGLKTVVFRQSCIYGPRQFGIEDQGWLAWFAIRALQKKSVTLYGDGKQVRDVLYIDDLLNAFDLAIECIESTSGQAYNIGGGIRNTLSLLELIDVLEEHFDERLQHSFEGWRPGDQLVYVSDIRKAADDFGWSPKVEAVKGVGKLVNWIKQNSHFF